MPLASDRNSIPNFATIPNTDNERNKPMSNEPNKPIEAEELKEKELEGVVGGAKRLPTLRPELPIDDRHGGSATPIVFR